MTSLYKPVRGGFRFASTGQRQSRKPRLPSRFTNSTLLQAQRNELLREDVSWCRGRRHRLNKPFAPKEKKARCPKKLLLIRREEQHAAGGPWPTPSPSHSLKKRGNGPRRTNLNNPIKISNVDPELER